MTALTLIGEEILQLHVGDQILTITSPWSDNDNPLSCDRLMGAHWIYLGSFANDDEVMIDFVSIKGFSTIARWTVSGLGEYVSQAHFPSTSSGTYSKRPPYTHVNSSKNLIRFGKRFSNDMEIYLALKFLLGSTSGAEDFMQSYAPPERKEKRKSKSASVNLTIIFNHNYARNIRHLDDVYCDRFTRVLYMLPNVAPKSDRCFSFPAGSFAYHTLIFSAIDRMLHLDRGNLADWYLFVHDDVYLHPNFSQNNLETFFSITSKSSCAYYQDCSLGRWDYNSSWPWNRRLLNRLSQQKDATVGNGFEGFLPFFNKEEMVIGISDIFAVRGQYLSEFVDLLGNFISQDIFPEASIPTSLKLLASTTDTEIGTFSGEYLWENDRKKVTPDYIETFDKGRHLFLHPVKAALIH